MEIVCLRRLPDQTKAQSSQILRHFLSIDALLTRKPPEEFQLLALGMKICHSQVAQRRLC